MNDQILTEFYQQRPELDVRANDGFLIEKATKPISVQSLTLAASQLEGVLLIAPVYQAAWDDFVLHHPEKKGTAFRRQFLDGMRVKAQKHEHNSLVQELGREDLRSLPLDDLRKIAATQRENKRRKSLSVAELRELARVERPVPQPDGLPAFYLPIGKKKAVELTAEVLRRAGTRTGELSTADLKFLIRRYGSTEVNKRLGVRPRQQPGVAINLPVVE